MIDWNRVKDLREEVGASDFAEVTEIFFEEIEEVIDRLPDIKEAEPMAHALHFLRSGSLNLGFKALAERCDEGEMQAESGVQTSIDLAAILHCYSASKLEFLDGMAQIQAA